MLFARGICPRRSSTRSGSCAIHNVMAVSATDTHSVECSSFLQMNQPQRDNTRFTHTRALTCAAPLIWGAVSDPEETGTEYVAGSKGRQCQQLVATSAPAFTPDARGVPHMQSKQVYLTRGRAMQTPTSSYMACASDR